MTLHFFRRKPTAARAAAQKAAPEGQAVEPGAPAKVSRGRRATTRPAGRSEASAEPAASETKATPPKQTSATRTRRGRRGGAGRKAKAKVAEAATSAAEAAPVIPLRAQPETLEGLLAQQQAAFQQLSEQQVSLLRGLQGSLSAIENRLASMDPLAASTERPRVGIFVDVPNVIYAADRQGVTLDFKKVLEFLVHGRELVRASAYAPISDDPKARLETQKFVQPFADLGYRLVTKPHKRYADGSMKANFDVELAMDVLTMSDRLDIVTLVSGDGDFRRLVELVASKGVRVEVVAFSQSTAAELRAVSDKYIDLNEHVDELRKT